MWLYCIKYRKGGILRPRYAELGGCMNHDEKILAIETERLDMEKRRDRHASLRFLIGSVLLVVGTSGASLYINTQQDYRSLVN